MTLKFFSRNIIKMCVVSYVHSTVAHAFVWNTCPPLSVAKTWSFRLDHELVFSECNRIWLGFPQEDRQMKAIPIVTCCALEIGTCFMTKSGFREFKPIVQLSETYLEAHNFSVTVLAEIDYFIKRCISSC